MEDTAKVKKKLYDAKRYQERKDEINKRNREWAKNNPDKISEYGKKWRDENKDWIENWHKDNREKINKYCRDRLRNNPHLRVHANFSRNIHHSIKQSKNRKSWEDIVGYTADDLMDHLENLFTEGMSWDNYGRYGWHIDHIIPKDSFNIMSENCPDFKKCWAISNLQPLWEADNCSKGNKIL